MFSVNFDECYEDYTLVTLLCCTRNYVIRNYLVLSHLDDDDGKICQIAACLLKNIDS